MTNDAIREAIGKSLGRIPSGVAILTTQHQQESGAMLCSWFQQISFEPPMISIAVKKGRWVTELVQASRNLVLNILHTGQKNMLAHFGKGFERGQNPYEGIAIETQKAGAAILKEALCYLECELQQSVEVGDHQILLLEVLNAGAQEEGAPMVHLRRNGFYY
ncbi:MAG: flavin reductase family protein [Deltaproteobacteria bacterium]|nr:flavin reductase family protein [Deltaproteobacteria bacterium]